MTRLAFVFPGQAAHVADMAAAWAGTPSAEVIDRIGRAAGIVDLAAVADDPVACAATAVAQPAILATSLAAFVALTDAGVTPDVVAGHSLGEVTAAIAAGVLDVDTGGAVVGARGRAFADACASTPGVMAAVLGAVDELETIVAGVEDLVVANQNAPGQVVVAGTDTAIAALEERLAGTRARVRALDVEGAFHSPAMTPAVAVLADALACATLTDPAVSVVSGIDGRVRDTAAGVRDALVHGVTAPVRWVDVQHRLASLADVVVEVGPGGVLARCLRRTVPDLPVLTAATPDDVAAVRERLHDLAHDAPAA